MVLHSFEKYAPVLVRLSLSFVFLWFGFNQLFFAEDFMSYLPNFILTTTYASTIILLNGLFEILFGTLLLIGLFTRFASFLLGLHLIGIIMSLGYNDIAIRDIGLMFVSFAITLGGADIWCFDYRRNKKKNL